MMSEKKFKKFNNNNNNSKENNKKFYNNKKIKITSTKKNIIININIRKKAQRNMRRAILKDV